MANWMSLRAYSRHRGDALSAVQKAIKDGRVGADAVRRNEAGRLISIDQVLADVQWARNTDPIEAAKSGKSILASRSAQHEIPARAGGAPTKTDPAVGEAQSSVTSNSLGASGNGAGAEASGELPLHDEEAEDDPGAAPAKSSDDPHGFYEARARKIKADADSAELDYLKKVGLLVSADDVRREQFEIFRRLRDGMMVIADRMAPRLAAETDPSRVHHLLIEETRGVLREFSSTLGAEAAGGACPGGDARA